MAQWLSMLAALGENLSSVPITHIGQLMNTSNSRPRAFLLTLAPAHTHTQTREIFQNANKETSGGSTYTHFLEWYFIDVCVYVPNLAKSYQIVYFI